MKGLLALLFAAACASGGAARHTTAARAAPSQAYAFDGVFLEGPRAGQLSASREWQRMNPMRGDDIALRGAFAHDLSQRVPLDPAAPLRLRTTLTLQDTGYYEGFAAETTDVTLDADIIDPSGAVVRTITLREPASAPLQRSASRRQRLEAAFTRLADRLSAQL
jgi:hypothetical protein